MSPGCNSEIICPLSNDRNLFDDLFVYSRNCLLYFSREIAFYQNKCKNKNFIHFIHVPLLKRVESFERIFSVMLFLFTSLRTKALEQLFSHHTSHYAVSCTYLAWSIADIFTDHNCAANVWTPFRFSFWNLCPKLIPMKFKAMVDSSK